ncbi:CRISPR-associated endonuclease Cas2 [Cuniculiplasma sp. SKW3]|uniref:CRISPR-associated endonuclease Cas2 n=1 Tax=Cuniculiplasma sp. SKW3 TaxID=3400170 RepID=UPI003FD0B14A
MWIILTYDINTKRVNEISKICRQYLRWVQNSVFIGYITKANLTILLQKINKKIEKEEDGVQIFILRDQKQVKRISVGLTKEFSNII